jgi:putative DNA primase/helicase
MAVTRQIMAELESDGKYRLRYWRGIWVERKGPQWIEIDELDVRAVIYKLLEHAVYKGDRAMVPWLPSRFKVTNVIDAMKATSRISSEISPPARLDAPDEPITDVVSCASGLLNIVTREVSNHTPDFFTFVSVPFAYAPDAPEPVLWLKFLNEIWPNDPESILALQQFIGYIISGRTDIQKILMLAGAKRGGKGVIARIITALVGARSVAGMTVSAFQEQFGMQSLLGKGLAIISDARLNPKFSAKLTERLLSISGEDSISVDKKHRDPYTGPIPARIVYLSNEVPIFQDPSGAMADRFIILQFVNSWLGKEDTHLTDKLMEELPGIMRWALDGLDSLRDSGSIEEPDSAYMARGIISETSSPEKAFLDEMFIRDMRYTIRVDKVYEMWKVWCLEKEIDDISSKPVFGRNLHAAAPWLRAIQIRQEGERIRCYRGLQPR